MFTQTTSPPHSEGVWWREGGRRGLDLALDVGSRWQLCGFSFDSCCLDRFQAFHLQASGSVFCVQCFRFHGISRDLGSSGPRTHLIGRAMWANVRQDMFCAVADVHLPVEVSWPIRVTCLCGCSVNTWAFCAVAVAWPKMWEA